jgi:hypothetical protein
MPLWTSPRRSPLRSPHRTNQEEEEEEEEEEQEQEEAEEARFSVLEGGDAEMVIDRTRPGAGGETKVAEIYSDRYIPSRSSSRLEAGFTVLQETRRAERSPSSAPSGGSRRASSQSEFGSGDYGSDRGHGQRGQPTLNMLLRSELLGVNCASPKSDRGDGGLMGDFGSSSGGAGSSRSGSAAVAANAGLSGAKRRRRALALWRLVRTVRRNDLQPDRRPRTSLDSRRPWTR